MWDSSLLKAEILNEFESVGGLNDWWESQCDIAFNKLQEQRVYDAERQRVYYRLNHGKELIRHAKYREALRADPDQYEEYLAEARRRAAKARELMTPEQRAARNAALREYRKTHKKKRVLTPEQKAAHNERNRLRYHKNLELSRGKGRIKWKRLNKEV